jgi:KipI family sensor histidine kinase inhibitor
MEPRISRLGEETWLVEFEPRLDAAISERVLALASAIEQSALAGVFDVVPAYASLAIHADPEQLREDALIAAIRDLADARRSSDVGRLSHEIPVCYDPLFALDLDAVCAATGCTAAEVIARHGDVRYRVFMIGFLPGFPYMGMVPESIAVPRRATPRPVVPAGSVGIAGRQTGIYPVDSPGGWQIVGRTPVRLFDPLSGRPPLVRAGDHVRFVPIDISQFRVLAAATEQPH